MIKTLIVTYYCTNNYGSFLQAYALGSYLRNNGCEVFYWGSKELEEENEKYCYNQYRKDRDKKLLEARQEFKIDYECKQRYDLLVVGSDVVWASPKIDAFWLKGFRGKVRISYSASMWGFMDNHNYPDNLKILFERLRLLPRIHLLKHLDGISVRDDRTLKSIRKILGKRNTIIKTLDPTFLLEKEKIENLHPIIKERYILVYSYALVGEDVNPVFEYASEHNCKICVVGYRAVFADYNMACDPDELLSLFKFAEAIITTTFHGTALSIITHGNFVTFESKKARELLKDMGLSDRLGDSNTALKILEQKIDYKIVENYIDIAREQSETYLKYYIKMAGKRK